MPLGIVSDSEFEQERLDSDTDNPVKNDAPIPTEEIVEPTITSDVIIQQSAGRHSDVTNVPQSLRKLLGEEASTNGIKSAQQLVDSLVPAGLSRTTLSTYARGEISPGTKNPDLLAHINNRKSKLSKRALNKLNLALTYLDDGKIAGCSAVELASVAKSMADVAGKLEPSVKEEQKDPIQFHIYAPTVRQETHYETVVAKDNY